MSTKVKRKKHYLEESKIRRPKVLLGTKTETEEINAALNVVRFRQEIVYSLQKVAGKGGVQKVL